MDKRGRYSPEVRERAVRMIREHERQYASQWAAITSIAGKIGCTAEPLRLWVRQGSGVRVAARRRGPTADADR